MKPRRVISLVFAVAALTALAAGTRKMIPDNALVQSTVSAAATNMTPIAAGLVLTPQGNLEYDTNRPGADYRNFEIAQADPAICRNECASDSTCKAFTYVKPGLQGARAHCWLKSDVTTASANTCCVSGIKSGSNSSSGLEVNVNRLGGDYRDYELADNNPNHCRDDCMADSRCQSFTFLRPSYRGPNAHCFLKNSVPAATQETCCISGVKAGGGGGCRSEYTMNAPSSAGVYQKINISFTAPADHDPRGWMGIYAAGATPGKDGNASWEYVSAEHQCSGAVTLNGVPAGQYVVYYFLTGAYDKIATRSNLTVR
ncbi:MAG TPA: PAN domain-containing protein [Pyrinomonadaceae bacterium]